MKRATSGISLTLALSAGLIGAMLSPALADGDPYYSNGINPSGVRTPVPAPIPYPVEEADWYFRADFAAGFGATPSIGVLGLNYADLFPAGLLHNQTASSPRSPAASASAMSGGRTSAPT